MSAWSEKYSKVVGAVRRGELTKPKDSICEVCGIQGAVKHHDDNSKPLDVIYLCHKCHKRRHKQLGWGISGRPKVSTISEDSKQLRISLDIHERLKVMSALEHRPLQQIVDDALRKFTEPFKGIKYARRKSNHAKV